MGDKAAPEPVSVAGKRHGLIIVKLRSYLYPWSWLPWNHRVPQKDVGITGKREGRMNLGKYCIMDFPPFTPLRAPGREWN